MSELTNYVLRKNGARMKDRRLTVYIDEADVMAVMNLFQLNQVDAENKVIEVVMESNYDLGGAKIMAPNWITKGRSPEPDDMVIHYELKEDHALVYEFSGKSCVKFPGR